MKKKPVFPYKVKRGSAVVRVYEVSYGKSKNGQPYTCYRVAWYDTQNKQKTDSYGEWETAIAEAEAKANELSRGELDAVALTGREKLSYVRACDALQASGTPLDVAASRFASALKRLGRLSFEQAIEFAATHLNPDRPTKTVREVLQEMVAAKKADGVSDYRIRDLNVRCGAFADTVKCTVEEITLNTVNDYLRNLTLHGKTKNHYRGDIVTLLRFAISRGYLSKDFLDFNAVQKSKEVRNPILIYTPDELSQLLKAASAEGEEQMLLHLTLGAFAGIRRDERLRLDWSNFDFEDNQIMLNAHITKTNMRRVAPILPVLAAWLKPLAKERGPVFPTKKTQREEERIVKASGVAWKKNALRHSFISYRAAETKNMANVSYETGTLIATMNRHYRELVRPSDALKWFSLTPEQVKKAAKLATVTPIPTPEPLAQAA